MNALKIGIAGAGFAARFHLENFPESGVEVVGEVARVRDALQQASVFAFPQIACSSCPTIRFASSVRHLGAPVDHPRDGRCRHAGEIGHLADRQAVAAAVLWAGRGTHTVY